PAAAMGATFPIATDWFARSARESIAVSAYQGSRSTQKLQSTPAPYAAGVLYAVNTVGAAAGAVAAGFFLVPAIGLRATTWVGVALNLVAAGGAWWLASQPTTRNAKPAEPAKQDSQKHSLRAFRASRSKVVVSHSTPVLASDVPSLS